MAQIDVRMASDDAGWVFQVTVTDGDGQTTHRVAVALETYERLTGQVCPRRSWSGDPSNFSSNVNPRSRSSASSISPSSLATFPTTNANSESAFVRDRTAADTQRHSIAFRLEARVDG